MALPRTEAGTEGMGEAGLALSGCRTFKKGHHLLDLVSGDRAKSAPSPAMGGTWKGVAPGGCVWWGYRGV